MVVLTIGNSYSKITGLSPKQEKELRQKLSYMSGSFFGGFGPRKVSLLSKRGEFPTGLLSQVKVFLKTAAIAVYIADNRLQAGHEGRLAFKNKVNPYKWQLEALDFAEACHQGTISACTGSGKSLLIALIAQSFNVRTLVVVPTREIKKQLTEAFLALFKDLSNLDIKNIDDPSLFNDGDYGCLIIDECHHTAAKTYHKLNKQVWNGIYYRIALTATPFRNNTEETLLFKSICGEILYTLNYKQAALQGYVVPVEAYYIDTPKLKSDAETYRQVYSELVVGHDVANSMIALTLLRLNAEQKATLCLVREVAHGRLLSDATGLPFVHGDDDESRDYIRQFNAGEIKALIGTTGVLGEGIDSKPAEYVIIAGMGKAKSNFMQQIGRVIRTFPGKESGKVILIRNPSHKYLLRHFREQIKILKEEYNVIPLKLEL